MLKNCRFLLALSFITATGAGPFAANLDPGGNVAVSRLDPGDASLAGTTQAVLNSDFMAALPCRPPLLITREVCFRKLSNGTMMAAWISTTGLPRPAPYQSFGRVSLSAVLTVLQSMFSTLRERAIPFHSGDTIRGRIIDRRHHRPRYRYSVCVPHRRFRVRLGDQRESPTY